VTEKMCSFIRYTFNCMFCLLPADAGNIQYFSHWDRNQALQTRF